MRIMIVEDEKQLNDLLFDYIKASYKDADITQITDGLDALNKIDDTYDLFLLDVMLPHVGGFEILKALRKKSKAPVIMLSALNDEESQLKGFELGVDDYVTKPYSPKIVINKIKAILARYHHESPDDLKTYGIIAYNFEKYEVFIDQEKIELNKKEWELFSLFIQNIGHVYTREDLLNILWGYDYFGYERTVDTHIKRLRQKLKTASGYVKTVYKSGYKFEK